MPPATEQQLLFAARGGDRAALETLLRPHEARLYHLSLRMLHHPQDAADCTQETFLRAITRLHQFDQRSAFATWLTRIAIHEALSMLRKRKVRRHVSLDQTHNDARGHATTMADQLADHRELSPASGVQEKEMIEQLHEAIARLEADQRAVLLLRDLEQMDYQQIAEVLDMPVGTVKSRLFRAREALRSLMGQADAKGGAS